MIEINLLPKEYRTKKVELPSFSLIPVISIIVCIHLLLAIASNVKARSLADLEERWQALQPDKEIADAVKNELTTMRERIDAIDNLIQGRVSWSKKLSDLSDAMIPGVWLNKLWLEQKTVLVKTELKAPDAEGGGPKSATRERIVQTLHLSGSVIATGGEETAAIGRFIKSLKNNAGFFSDFTEIETTSIQRSRLKEVEVMDFELVCFLKD